MPQRAHLEYFPPADTIAALWFCRLDDRFVRALPARAFQRCPLFGDVHRLAVESGLQLRHCVLRSLRDLFRILLHRAPAVPRVS